MELGQFHTGYFHIRLLHTDSFTHGHLHTRTVSHTVSFTSGHLHTKTLSHVPVSHGYFHTFQRSILMMKKFPFFFCNNSRYLIINLSLELLKYFSLMNLFINTNKIIQI